MPPGGSSEREEAICGSESLIAGRFRIETRLGEGSTGLVYRAFDQQQAVLVALKKLKSVGPSALLRFKREFRTLQNERLHHPNLVRLRELFEADGEWYLSMDLVDGTDLLQFVRPAFETKAPPSLHVPTRTLTDGPESSERATVLGAGPSPREAPRPPRGALDESRLRSCLRQLAHALQALHATGSVHRDVKPSNVRVTPEGRLVLLDFGLLTEPEVHTNERVGTPFYMAPEQGLGAKLGPAADWYAFGVVLYEALTGLLPFSGTTAQVQVQKEMASMPRPRLFTAGIPEDLEVLCLELLHPDPARRASGSDVLARLEDPRSDSQRAVVGARARRDSSRASDGIVGRDAELAALAEAHAASRSALVVFSVTGESGIGKSTLVRWFARHHLVRTCPEGVALVSQCFQPEYVAFKAFDGIVDELARVLQRVPAAVVDELVPAGAGLLTRAFPVLLGLAAFARARTDMSVPMDPREHRPLVCAAMRELLSRTAKFWPLSIVIDDLQWSDEDSLFMLEMLVRSPQRLPLMLIVTSRSGADTSLNVEGFLRGLRGDVRQLPLASLGAIDARLLALSLLPGDASPATAAAIASEGGGHPLFIEELCLGQQIGSGASLDEVMRRRLQQLQPQARIVLELIAIAGVPVEVDVISLAIGANRPEELSACFASLSAARMVRTSIHASGERAEMYHLRLGTALLSSLSAEVLRERHASLARAAETLDRLDSEFLARHWHAAGEHGRAAALALQAADEAASALAFDHACQLFRWSFELSSAPEQQSLILRKLGDALSNAGRGVEAAAVYLRIAALEQGDEELERRAAEQLVRVGKLTEAREILARVLARERLPLPRTKNAALARLLIGRLFVRLRGYGLAKRRRPAGPAELRRADLCKNIAQGLAAIEPIEGALYQTRQLILALRSGDPQQAARALAVEATFLAWGGTKTDSRASAALTQAAALAQSNPNDLYTLASIQWATSITKFLSCRFRESLAELEKAEALFRRGGVGVSWELAMSRLFAFWSRAHLGRFDELRRTLPAEVELADKVGDQLNAVLLRSGISNVTWLALDQPLVARENAALEVLGWSQPGFQFQHAVELAALVDVDIYEGNPVAALERIARTWPKFRGSGMLQLQYIRINLYDRRGRALLMAERDWSGIAACARRLEAEAVPFASGLARLLRAGLERCRGRRERAAALYDGAAHDFETQGFEVHAAAARLRQAALMKAEGAPTRAQALDSLSRSGVVDPERMAALIAPA